MDFIRSFAAATSLGIALPLTVAAWARTIPGWWQLPAQAVVAIGLIGGITYAVYWGVRAVRHFPYLGRALWILLCLAPALAVIGYRG